MAGYVSIGNPIVKSVIVDETDGLGSGVFVEVDPATNKATLPDASTVGKDLYFTVNVPRVQYLGNDATAVVAKGSEINAAAVQPTNEVIMTVAATTGFAQGDEVCFDANGALIETPTAAGSYIVFGTVIAATTFNGLPALNIRLVTPYTKTVAG